MKRDNDLIRELMLKLEALKKRPGDLVYITPDAEEIAVEGYTMEQVEYHMDQLDQSHFFEAGNSARPMVGWAFRSITPQGHDFIDSVRDPKTWRKVKQVMGKAGGAGLGVLVEVAKAVGRAELTKLGILPAA